MAEWTSAALGDLFDMQLGKMLSAVTRIGPRQRPFLANRNVQWNRLDLTDLETMQFSASEERSYGLKNGDLLVCEGGEIGRTAIWAGELIDCHIQNAIHRLRPKDGSIAPRYFLHFMRLAADHGLFRRLSGQTSIAHLTKEGLRQLVIPVPPVAEQWGISEILDTVDKAISSTERLIAKLEVMKEGLLTDLLSHGIDDQGTLGDSICNRDEFVMTNLGPLPRTWSVALAGECCERISVGVVNSATYAYVASGVPFIRSQNVRPNMIDREDMLHVTQDFSLLHAQSTLRAGDVVIVRTGYPGTAAVVPADLDGSNCFSLVTVRVGHGLDPQFLAFYLNSPAGKSSIARTHFGSAQHNFNVGEMKRLPIVVPPLAEQHEIVRRAQVHEAAVAVEQDTLGKLNVLKVGLMEDLLTGRVSVRPADEDAA